MEIQWQDVIANLDKLTDESLLEIAESIENIIRERVREKGLNPLPGTGIPGLLRED